MSMSINWTRYANGDDEVAKGIDGIDGESDPVYIEGEVRPVPQVASVQVQTLQERSGWSLDDVRFVYVEQYRHHCTPLEARRLAAALLACADVAEGKEVG